MMDQQWCSIPSLVNDSFMSWELKTLAEILVGMMALAGSSACLYVMSFFVVSLVIIQKLMLVFHALLL